MKRPSLSRRVRTPHNSSRRVRSKMFETLEKRNMLATFTWDGGGGDNNWQTAANWADDIAPGINDDLVFPAGAAQLTSNNNYMAATFRSIAFTGSGYDLQGNGIRLTDGISQTGAASSNHVTLDVTLGGTQSFVNNGAGSLGVNKSLFLDGYTLTLDGSSSINLNSWTGSSISGIGNLIRGGTGSTTLINTVDNTYVGTTTVNAGATLQVTSGITTAISIPGALNIAGTFNLGRNNSVAATAAVTVQGGTFNVAAFVNTIGSLEMTGGSVTGTTGTLTLDGNLTTSASATAATITGNLALNSEITVADGAAERDLDIEATIVSGGFTKLGAGALWLGGASPNTGMLGASVHEGTLVLNKPGAIYGSSFHIGQEFGTPDTARVVHEASDAIVTTSWVTVYDSGRYTVGNYAQTLDELNVEGGTVVKSGFGAITVGDLYLLGGTIQTDSAALVVEGSLLVAPSAITSTISGNLDLGGDTLQFQVGDGTAATDLLVSAVVSNGSLTKTGAGTMALTAANTYAGATTISAGVLNISHATALGTTAAGTTITSGAVLEVQGNITVVGESVSANGHGIGAGGALRSRSGNNEWQGSINVGATGSIGVDNGSVLVVSQAVSGDAFAKWGSGRLDFTAANTYTGSTEVIGGTLRVSHAQALGTTATGTVVQGAATLELVGNVSITGETLTIYNSSAAIRNVSGNNSWTGAILVGSSTTISIAAGILDIYSPINTNGNLLTLSVDSTEFDAAILRGVISGSGALWKSGTGKLAIHGENTYSGLTTIHEGRLTLYGNGRLGNATSGTVINADGTLFLDTVTPVTENISAIGGGLNSDGAIRGSDGAQLTGNVTILGTTSIVGVGNGVGGMFLVSGEISDGVQDFVLYAVSENAGTLALSGTNLYSGFTRVAGRLQLYSPNAVPATSRVQMEAGGTLIVDVPGITLAGLFGTGDVVLTHDVQVGSANLSGTLYGNISGVSGFTKIGSGTQTVIGTHTYLGTTQVQSGTLVVNGDLADGYAAVDIVVASGATLSGDFNTEGALEVQSGGILAVAEAITGAVTMATGSTLRLEAGSQQLVPLEAMSLDGVILDLQVSGPYTPGETIVLINKTGNDPVSGSFANLTEGTVFTVGGETFQIFYQGGDGNDVGLVALDLSGLSISFSTSSQSVTEAAGVLQITAQLSSPATAELNFPVQLTGTASNVTDYTVLQGVFTFPIGATEATIELEVLDDTRFEGLETIVATLTPANGVTAGAIGVHTIDIANNDLAPNVSFSTASQVGEEGTVVNIEVQLDAESDLPVTVPLNFGGSANGLGDDYSFIGAGEIIIPAGQRTASLAVNIVDDITGEGAELIIVSMGTLINANASTAADAVLTQVISIPQNDAPTVTFVGASRSVSEGSGTTIQVRLSNPVANDITVPFSLRGTLSGSEYSVTPHTPYQVTFLAGETVANIGVDLHNDVLDEPTETLIVTLGSTPDYILGPGAVFTLQVTDDDIPRVSFIGSSATFWENVGTVTYTVELSNPSTSTISVPITVSGTGKVATGDATRTTDFSTSVANIVFAPGQTSVTRSITIVNDNLNEPTEDFTIALIKPSNAELGSVRQKQFIIKDNDPLANIKGSVDSVTEGNTSVNFKVTLSAATNVNVTVPFKLSGSATKGKDYNLSGSSVLIPAGQTSATINVSILEDTIDEDTQDLRVTLTEPSGDAKLGATASDAISIKDDDAAPGIRFDTPSSQLSANEYNVTRTITVELTKVSGRDVTVTFAFSGGAVRNTDYTVSGLDSSNRLVIKAGQTSGSFTIKTKDDAIYQGNLAAVITLKSVSNATLPTKAADLKKTFTIIDNDSKPVPITCWQEPVWIDPIASPGSLAIGSYSMQTVCGQYKPAASSVPSGGVAQPVVVSDNFSSVSPFTLALGLGMQGSLVGTTAFFDSNFNGVADFLDLNGNRLQDDDEPSEPSALTELDGSFGIVIGTEFDTNLDELIDTSEGRWVLAGGVDASTGLPWVTRMYAPVGIYAITPLTTLIESLVRTEGMTVEDAMSRVTTAFGLGDFNPATTSPLEGILAGDGASALAYAAHVKIYSTVIQVAELFHGASNGALPIDYLADLVYDDIAAKIADPNTELDVTLESNVQSVIGGISAVTGIAFTNDVIEGAATIIAAGNQAVDDVQLSADMAYATAVVKVKHVLQEDAALALRQVGNGSLAIADAVAEFTGTALAGKVAAATVNIVVPPSITIGDAKVVEGDSGQKVLEFQVALNGDHDQTVSVDFSTQDGEALVGADYDATNGTLTWAPGDTSPRIVQVTVHGDTTFEADEFLSLVLTNNVNAVIRAQRGTGYIMNDDLLSYTAPVNPGAPNNIEALLNATQAFLTQNGTAIVEGYQTAALDATFTGQDNQDDTLTLDFTANSFRSDVITFHGGGGTGFDTAVIRGGVFSSIIQVLTNTTDGHTTLTPADSSEVVNFHWFGLEPFLLDAEAIVDIEFVIPDGVTDAILEDADPTDDAFPGMLKLYSPSNAFESTTFLNPSGVLKIRGGAAVVSVGSLDSNFTGDLQVEPVMPAEVNVSIPEDSVLHPVTITLAQDYNTAPGSIVYTVESYTNPGLLVVSPVQDDGAGPYFTVTSTANQHGSGVVVIRATDPDGLYSETSYNITVTSVNDPPVGANKTVSASENDPYVFTLADFEFSDPLDNPPNGFAGIAIVGGSTSAYQYIRVDGQPIDTDALISAADIAAGKVVFTPPVDTSGTNFADFQFVVIDDGLGHDVSFSYTMTIDITPDNLPPVINNQSFTVNENLTLGAEVGTVVASDPDLGDSLTYLITAGNTSGAFAIDNDGLLTVANAAAIDYETNPTFTLLVQVTDGSGATDNATITINLNDLHGTLSIADASVAEGDSGTTNLTFVVTLTGVVGKAFSVDATTDEGTAGDGIGGDDSDFTAIASTLNFTGTSASETVNFTVTVHGDNKVELSETLSAILSNLLGTNDVTIVDGTAQGTTTNDDSATVAINDVSQSETNGTTTFTFTVTLSNPVDAAVSLNYETNDGTATTANNDYSSASGSLNFLANTSGSQTRQVVVTVQGDDIKEVNETFFVNLLNLQASGRSVSTADAQGIGTIQDDGDQALRFEAETDLRHQFGRVSGDGWSTSVALDPAGFMSYGPYTSAVGIGKYTATFRLMVDGAAPPNVNVATLDVWDARTGKALGSRFIRRSDFTANNVYQDFVVPFEVKISNALLEFRTQWHDVAEMKQDYVEVAPRIVTELVFEAETHFYHQIGRADADGWKASVAQDSPGYLAYGPYTTQVVQGFHTASFRLMVDGTAASNQNVATIDVWDVRAGRPLASKNIRRGDFSGVNVYQDFDLEFAITVDNALLEFRTNWYDVADMRLDAVRVSPREVQQLIFEAESDLHHLLGRAMGDAWGASVALDAPGYMNFGPYTSQVEAGLQTATFRMLVGSNVTSSTVVATVDVFDARSNTLLASRQLTRGNFTGLNTFQEFDVPFEVTTDNSLLEFRTYWHDRADVQQDWVRVMPRKLLNLKLEAESDLYHQIGRASGNAWSVNTTQDGPGYLSYGPYTSAVGAGDHEATFRLLTSSNVGSNALVVTIDVWDARTNQSLARRQLHRYNFSTLNTFQDFDLPFTVNNSDALLEFRTFWHDAANASLDWITIDRDEAIDALFGG